MKVQDRLMKEIAKYKFSRLNHIFYFPFFFGLSSMLHFLESDDFQDTMFLQLIVFFPTNYAGPLFARM